MDNTTRKVTNRVLQLINEGVLDTYSVLLAALNYMSEDDVADMARVNELLDYMDDDSDDDSE